MQNHFEREQEAHLWPQIEGIQPFPDSELERSVEIGFRSAEDQTPFNAACSILCRQVEHVCRHGAEPSPNGDDGLGGIHVHFGASHAGAARFGERMDARARSLAAEDAVLKVRLHLPEVYDNTKAAPPTSNVDHEVPRSGV